MEMNLSNNPTSWRGTKRKLNYHNIPLRKRFCNWLAASSRIKLLWKYLPICCTLLLKKGGTNQIVKYRSIWKHCAVIGSRISLTWNCGSQTHMWASYYMIWCVSIWCRRAKNHTYSLWKIKHFSEICLCWPRDLKLKKGKLFYTNFWRFSRTS